MIHKNTTDNIRVVTSSAADTDVVLTYQLYANNQDKSDYTSISSATSTDIELPDQADAQITSFSVSNKHASTANTVTIAKRNASVNYTIIKVTLAAGESLTYEKGNGWKVFTSTGKLKVEVGSGGGGGAAWGGITGTLADQTDLQAALDAKEDIITATTSADYYRGDKTFQTLNKAAVGLSNVDNTSDATKNAATATLTNKTLTAPVINSPTGIVKADVGLSNVDNTSDATKPVSTAQAAADAAVSAAANAYADSLVVGLLDDRGNYDASTNLFPSSGGSGSAGAILKGDLWTISVGGTLGGSPVTPGDVVRALVDTPGTTASNWAISENNIGYVAENQANKDSSGGYAGLTLFKLNLRNVANTVTSWFTNTNTSARTYTLQDRDGTIADDTDITGAKNRANHTGTQLASTISDFNAAALAAAPAETGTTSGALINGATSKATPVDADQIGLMDSAASNVLKKLSWANLKATLKTYFDSLTTTFTNKRITKRVTSITSSATPTVNTDNCDVVTITALAAAITSMTTNLSGTPTNFQTLVYRIKDNGTARAITWGASFEARGVALPSTTVISKVLTVGFIYDTVTSKWGCVASAQES